MYTLLEWNELWAVSPPPLLPPDRAHNIYLYNDTPPPLFYISHVHAYVYISENMHVFILLERKVQDRC